LLFTLLPALLAACAPAGLPAEAYGNIAEPAPFHLPPAVSVDPPRDPASPARNRQLVIPSGPVRAELGRPAEMNALFLLAAGEGPHPTLLLLHGLPGNERNLDLAQAVRRAGWNVLAFTYRGAWGSEGTFSIRHAIEDARTALALLRSPAAVRDYRVDPNRIVVAGHSMGGMAAALVAAGAPSEAGEQAPQVHFPPAGLILLDAWNAGATARTVRAAGAPGRAAFIAGLDDLGHALGPVTAADLADELIRRGAAWDLLPLAPALAEIPVLTIYARSGLAEENRALAAAIRARRGAAVTDREFDSDHAFADHRVTLAAEIVRWLEALPAAR
jgi:pimeloyl-ACP methyl ester carboxylesterase